MKVGDRMLWIRTISNYGHTEGVPVVVRHIGKRITVEIVAEVRFPLAVHSAHARMIGAVRVLKTESLRALPPEVTP